jgi:hypothetical protein
MFRYIVEYQYERDNTRHYKMLRFGQAQTWRELQNHFDPNYYYNNLKFFALGSEVPFTD